MMRKPFVVFETPAFIGVKDADGQRILTINCSQTPQHGAEPPYWQITEAQARARAEAVCVALNRTSHYRLENL